MATDDAFKIGSKIIEEGKVYLVFKIESVTSSGGVEEILHYRPFYTNPSNMTLSCSIPVKQIASSNLRKPVTRNELDEIMTYLTQKEAFVKDKLLDEAAILKQNSIHHAAGVLKKGLSDQKSSGKDFSLPKNGIIAEAVQKMLEEVALIYGISLEKAFQKIESASKKYYSHN